MITAGGQTTFTLSGYLEMIGTLLGRGYTLQNFEGVEIDQQHLVLRHDIDFDPEIAVEIAEAEAHMDWRSHYFVLTRSEFYNLGAPRCRAAIKKLIKLGHKVGLHFDAALYAPDHGELTAAVEEECAVIEAITATPADVFSLHRPHPDLLDDDLTVPGRLNAYAPGLFRDIGYVSDSRGAWHHGSPLDHQAVESGRPLQLLTHPIWWTGDPELSPHEKCAEFLAKFGERLDREMMRSCSAYLGAAGSEPE